VTRAGRATVVVEPPALPVPGSPADPRQAAIGAVVDELERLGIPTGYQTIVVAGGPARPSGRPDVEARGEPGLRRRFPGRVVVHDVEDSELVSLPAPTRTPLRVSPALAATDLVIVVSAAESVLNGGPAALLAAGGREALREAGANSLVETSASQGW